MFCYFLLFVTTAILTKTKAQEIEYISNVLDSAHTANKVIEADVFLMENKYDVQKDKVKIQLYYECLCADCRQFDVDQFLPTYLKLHDHLDVSTYPYGNAKTTKTADGKVRVLCQHGKDECYGNRLHACTVDLLANYTQALIFNSCMMDVQNTAHGSDDAAADKCGDMNKIDAAPIKECAKSKKGFDLLLHYGEESHKVHYEYVPYVLINGKEWQEESKTPFIESVCDQFKVKPSACESS